MKKILFTAFFVVSLGVMNAQQQLPNSGFESWSSGKPTGWNTLSLASFDIGTNSLTQSTDKYEGSSALKVSVSAINPLVKGVLQGAYPEASSLNAVPGLATNGTINFAALLPVIMQLIGGGELDPSLIPMLGNAIENGMTLTQKPVALCGAGKANLIDESNMAVAIALVYSGTGTARQMIGFGMTPIESSTSYEGFCATINYTDVTATPTELIAMFVVFTPNSEATAPYSSMLVDALNISYGSGINNPKLSNVSVYPNPAKNMLHINTSATQYEIQVVDMLGRVVMTENSKPTVNISDLTKGVYFVKVTQNGTTNTEKIVVE